MRLQVRYDLSSKKQIQYNDPILHQSMKRLFIIYALIICSCVLSAQEPVHVIITAGQSNTDGRIPNKELPDYIKAMTSDTTFIEGAYKFCKISQNRSDGLFIPYWPKGRITGGLWSFDAITYYLLEKALQEDFYVIKWAVGGTSIAYPNDTTKGSYWSANPEWLAKTTSTATKGKSLLLSFTEEIDACIDQTFAKLDNGYQIDAFLWHQGEGDRKKGSQYYDNLKGVVTYVRDHLTQKTGKDHSKLPFILGTVPRMSKQYNAEVEAGMKRLAEEDPNVYLIETLEDELQRDRIHFNVRTAEDFGKKVYERLAGILGL